MTERISVLVTDLDNTLWNWVAIWHAGFRSLVDVLVDQGGLDRETLLDETREIHQRQRTSEYAPLLFELPSLIALGDEERSRELRDAAKEAAQESRAEAMSLYPGVRESLGRIRAAGSLIVAYTESMAFQTKQRVRKLGLDGVIDYLYSSPDHDFPDDMPPENFRQHPDAHYELKVTHHRHVERGVVKPSPDVLRQIMSDVAAVPAATIYVGDSKMKDITMAKEASVRDVWAAYGNERGGPGYDLLKRVTHWPDRDVEKETALSKEGEVVPTYTLKEGFSELLELFEFERHQEADESER